MGGSQSFLNFLTTSPKSFLMVLFSTRSRLDHIRTAIGRFRIYFGRFRTVSDGFRTVSDGVGAFSDRSGPFSDRFRIVSDCFRTISDESVLNFKISNFNWPGLGHRRGRPPFRPVGADRRSEAGPSPGQLKFEISGKSIKS